MALADRLAAPRNAPMPGTPCSVGALLEQLDGPELDALHAMLGTPEKRGWSAREIYDAVIAEGYEIAYQTINRHRGRNCRCFRGVL